MKIFISWSGDRSRAVAELTSLWLKCVIQASQPWISTRDIQRGALWFSELNENLKDVSIGIVCLTHDNKDKPWILFEAGALAKGLATSRVCTLLVDLDPIDLDDPLAQFNHTKPNREEMFKLVTTINDAMGAAKLDAQVIERVFSTYWGQYESDFAQILIDHPQGIVAPPRKADDMMSELLEISRSLNRRMNNVEKFAGTGTSAHLSEWLKSNPYDYFSTNKQGSGKIWKLVTKDDLITGTISADESVEDPEDR